MTRNISYFPKKTGIGKIYSPHTILNKRQVDFKKEFIHYFSSYVQATDDQAPKNKNLPRSIDAIYLQADDTLQGGHEMMDLATGRVFRRPKITACTMTRMGIERMELIVTKKCYKSLKFFNRKQEDTMLTPSDILEGVVGDENAILDDEEFSPLPPLIFEGVEEEEEKFDVDEGISNKEIADLLSKSNQVIQGMDLNENNLPPLTPDEEEEESENENQNEICGFDQDSSSGSSDGGGDAPSLVSEPKLRTSSRESAESRNDMIHLQDIHIFNTAITWLNKIRKNAWNIVSTKQKSWLTLSPSLGKNALHNNTCLVKG